MIWDRGDILQTIFGEINAQAILGPGWQRVEIHKRMAGGYALAGTMDGGRREVVIIDLPEVLTESPYKAIEITERALFNALKELGSIGRPASLFVKA